MNTGRKRLISTAATGLALSFIGAPALAQDFLAPLPTQVYVDPAISQPTPLPAEAAAPPYVETQAQFLSETDPILLDTIVISAEEQIKQALGVSTITAEDIQRQPVLNDISQIIRRQPGVNLTGTTATGQRGNNRQIDLRGMGPENTLILIDGKPVLSRNAVKMGRQGERDTRGDSNWVAPELVERIEVLRGPAAARYGSGSSGGVVNIITKRPREFTGSVNTYFHAPQDNSEGGGKRVNFMLAAPVGETLSFRLTGNYNRTDADDANINLEALESGDRTARPAGREGVINQDVGALISWEPLPGHEIDFEANFSRQGNIYSGDSENSNNPDGSLGQTLAQSGAETNVMRRRALSLTHFGSYDFGSSFSYLQWENTRNSRLPEGGAGSTTGQINSTEMATIELDNLSAKTEWVLPFAVAGFDQSLTLGGEYRGEFIDDPVSNRVNIIGHESNPGFELPGVDLVGANRPTKLDQHTVGVYVESNILALDNLTLTPALRYDHSSAFGGGFSPSLNATYDLTDEWSAKVGVARAFKAPNLFQLNPNYVWATMGNGCPIDPATGARLAGPCHIVGNPDLAAETSLNKEVGLSYNGHNGISGSLTYFHNDYKDRISASRDPITPAGSRPVILRWENTPEAVVSGLEGNFNTPIGDQLRLNLNATYMLESKDKRNDQPLSLVPEYTINASLDWEPREDVVVSLTATHYGEIEGPSFDEVSGTNYVQRVRPSYTLFGLSGKWEINDNASVTVGVENLLDKQLYRTGLSGDPNSYNEPGRAFYVSLGATF